MSIIILTIAITMTCTMIVSLILFSSLLKLNLKTKNELSEKLKKEINEHRDIYNFIKKRRFINPETLVVDFQEVHPRSAEYIRALSKCKEELKERSSGKHNTLSKIGNFYELSEDAKKFFVYENPTLKELLRSVFMEETKKD